MLSLQEMSDRLEIQDLIVAYCDAIDSQDFDYLDNVFTPDALIDYTAAGGAKGDLDFIKSYLKRGLSQFSSMQHMPAIPHIKLDGDKASVRTMAFNPMIIERDGAPHVFFVGLWYVDEMVRTNDGWRITHRREEVSYFHNLPEDFAAVET